MKTQLPSGKPTGVAGRLPAAAPLMTSRTGSPAAGAMGTKWLKTALKTASVARTAIACTQAAATSLMVQKARLNALMCWISVHTTRLIYPKKLSADRRC